MLTNEPETQDEDPQIRIDKAWEQYFSIDEDMQKRKAYIEGAISQLKSGTTNSHGMVEVDQEAMIYILERSLDGVTTARMLNDAIYEHGITRGGRPLEQGG